MAGDPRGFAPVDVAYAEGRRRRVSAESATPVPPFWGARTIEASPKAIVPFINERSLYQFQWGFRKQGRSLEDFLGWAKQELRPVLARMLRLTGEQRGERLAALRSHPVSEDRLAALAARDRGASGAPLMDEPAWIALRNICGGGERS